MAGFGGHAAESLLVLIIIRLSLRGSRGYLIYLGSEECALRVPPSLWLFYCCNLSILGIKDDRQHQMEDLVQIKRQRDIYTIGALVPYFSTRLSSTDGDFLGDFAQVDNEP